MGLSCLLPPVLLAGTLLASSVDSVRLLRTWRPWPAQSALTLAVSTSYSACMFWFFAFFFISGFCSILYELVWLRLAMAEFGVTTALVSIVLSVFMGGLGAGSWISGALVRRYADRIRFHPLRLYAFSELLIAVSAVAVPLQLVWGNHLLGRMADRVPISSGTYYLVSGAWLALSLVPWSACMGATIPLAMFAIRRDQSYDSRRSFSFLYLSNVLGAVAGSIIPLFLIELYGFHGTLRIGAILNTLIFVAAFGLTMTSPQPSSATALEPAEGVSTSNPVDGSAVILLLLFTTGLATMGMEVIWIRLFSAYIGPVVYAFAKILAAYLGATFVGSRVYRVWSRSNQRESPLVWVSLAFFGLLSLLAADGRVPLDGNLRVLLGVAPFAGVIGFLTPMLVDRWSGGDPDRAGRAYAVNVVGCILGPLVAGFFLLPWFGEQTSMLLFALPWFAMGILLTIRQPRRLVQTAMAGGFLVAALALFFLTEDYEFDYPDRVELRDSTAPSSRHRFRHGQNAAGERGWDDIAHSGHQDDGAPDAGFPAGTTAQRADHLFRHGNHIPLGPVVEHSRDRGRTGSQRSQALHLLPPGR